MRATHADRRHELRRNLFAMNADGFAFSVMVGIGETYLPAFVLSRGMGELTAALIATVPMLLGSLLQLAAPLILKRIRSYRYFVVGSASLQAASLLILMGMALAPHVPPWAVFIPATIYWAAGLATGPAWNTWVEQLVPHRIRSGFFARRSRLSHIGVLAGLISGGLMLRWSAAHGNTVGVFAIMFAIGSTGRFISAFMLARQTQAYVERHHKRHPSLPDVNPAGRFREVMGILRHPGSAGRLVLFLMAMQTAVHVSGPYFTPFMLKSMQLSWTTYMGLLSLGFIGKMLSLPWAGRLANRAGADRLLLVGSLGIVPISALWMIRQDVWFLASIQVLSGLVWGCYELAMLLQFFRQIPAERRVGILTLYNMGNSAAMVLGSLIGAVILTRLGTTYDAYLTVFVASGVIRATAVLLLPGRRQAIRATRVVVSDWISRTIAVRPMAGTMERPVFAAMDDDEPPVAAQDADSAAHENREPRTESMTQWRRSVV
ncbi:MAG: MFS transporter [Planctomycetaceae bacterium]|nr:MFS transporter [Planctomycetaceae bacterium]